METLTKDITLGFYNETGILTVPISQGDIDRIIAIGFTNDGYKYEIPEDTIVYLKAQKPDGTQIDTDEYCSIVDNMVKIKVFKQLSAVDGIVKCELILSDSSGKIYTSNHFNIAVKKSVHADENLRSTDTYKNIIEILLEIQNIKQDIENLRNDLVFKTDKDQPNGIPSLDENAKIPREELYDADLNNKGVVKLVDSVTSDSTTDAATPNSVKTVNDDLQIYKERKDNPHDVTKEQIGLGNADNTSDINKPVSIAQQNALDLALSTHNTSTLSHNDIRLLISDLATKLNTIADSDDETLDQLSEIVSYIKNNKDLIDSVTTNKVNKVPGKDLSSNDYTDEDKELVDSFKNMTQSDALNILNDRKLISISLLMSCSIPHGTQFDPYNQLTIVSLYSNGEESDVTQYTTFEPVPGTILYYSSNGTKCTATYTEGDITKTCEFQIEVEEEIYPLT